tara:strand:- start:413 stop:565 length:153 start_codon:yes stop_codon:yes gene_type:complete
MLARFDERVVQASIVLLGGIVLYNYLKKPTKRIFKQKTRSSPITAAFKYA